LKGAHHYKPGGKKTLGKGKKRPEGIKMKGKKGSRTWPGSPFNDKNTLGEDTGGKSETGREAIPRGKGPRQPKKSPQFFGTCPDHRNGEKEKVNDKQ